MFKKLGHVQVKKIKATQLIKILSILLQFYTTGPSN